MRMVGTGLIRRMKLETQVATYMKFNSIKHSLMEMAGRRMIVHRGLCVRTILDLGRAEGKEPDEMDSTTESSDDDNDLFIDIQFKSAFGPKYLGALEVDKLPMDAWEKWCKHGVVCFGHEIDRMLKVYFADPRSLSVYHVIDFDYTRCELPWCSAGCILSGSKIYILGGYGGGRDEDGDPIDVYFCDLSTPPEFCDGNYEWQWQQGPSLNSHKIQPEVFSLMGNIYVFSNIDDGSDHFEVLKDGSCQWEVLPPPPPPPPLYIPRFWKRTFKINDKMVVINCGNDVVIYKAECNEWTKKELSNKDPFAQNPFARFSKMINFTMDCFHVEENGLFNPSEHGISQMRGFCSQFFQTCDGTKQLEIYKEPDWHLFQIKDRKFCFIALYQDNLEFFLMPRAQVGTFGLEECEEDSKHLKLGKSWFRVTDMKFKDTVLLSSSDEMAFPYKCCSTTGTFPDC
ncbi:hypothetical protein V6N13_035721 [Hibiscus sabdariffa]|uniref:F-box/kelch-repeat protein n=1 Tax=Hibiscus sabdariffa TaxID=183260 RepID=A0ABR2S8L5_9ROSI